MNPGDLLNDPDFILLLRRRGRLRWGLTGLLTAAYLAYGLGGLYLPAFFAARIAGSAVSLSILLGYGIILLGIACSIYYVRRVNQIIAPLERRLAREHR